MQGVDGRVFLIMKVKIKIEKEVIATLLKVEAGARYWEDSKVNGIEDTEGSLIPFREGDYWCPVIEIDTGKIIDWPEGTTASIHYKCCDNGTYTIQDNNHDALYILSGDYVPPVMCPKEAGYGDYIIMDIGADGFIKDWVCSEEMITPT